MLHLLLILQATASANADCAIGNDAMETIANKALDAYLALDVPQFQQELQLLQTRMTCLDELLYPSLSAQLHQIYALGAWLQEEPDASRASWRASMALEMGHGPDDSLIPPGSRIRTLYDEARVAGPGRSTAVGLDDLYVDGVQTRYYPTERASIVQRPLENGWQTEYTYGQLSESFVFTETAPPRSKVLLRGGMLTGVGAVLGLGTAAVVKAQYTQLPTDDSATALRVTNQITGVSGYTLGLTAVGFTTAALIVGEW